MTRLLPVLWLVCACTSQGRVTIDGSSTLAPLAETLTESYSRVRPDHEVVVRTSGSTAGIARLCRAEIDIALSAREITQDERAHCKVELRAISLAKDAIVVAVNPGSPVHAPVMTLAELRSVWAPSSTVHAWHDIRPDWPQTPLRLYGAGTFSGTFETFTRVVVGKERESRSDVVTSEDDGVLVYGMVHDPAALGYLGLAAFTRSGSQLRLVAVDFGNGPVLPTASSGYEPLKRTLYLYVDAARAVEEPLSSLLDHFQTQAVMVRGQLGYQ